MLSDADAALASRDSELPDLATVLDSERLLDLLRPEMSLEWTQLIIRPTYIRYKRGTSCLVGFQGEYRHQPISFYVRLHHPSQREKAAKPLKRRLAQSALGPGALLLETPCLLWMMFPNDHELGILRDVVDAAQRRHCLQGLIADPQRWEGSALTPLRYKPERRYVAQLTLADEQKFILKAHDRKFAKTRRPSANDFRGDGSLQLRPPIAMMAEHRLALYPWIEGTPLCEASALDLLQHVGSLLARLHSLNRRSPEPDRSASQSSTEAVAVVLQTTLAMLADLAPSQWDRARFLADRLLGSWCAQPDSLTAIHCLVHGDFSADQVILAGDQTWFIDFDRARIDHPVHDLGSCLARLHQQQLAAESLGGTAYCGTTHCGPNQQGGHDGHDGIAARPAASLAWADLEIRCQAIIQGYLHSSPWPLAPLIPLSLALHLFQLASEPFRQRDPDWLLRLDQILTRIDHILLGNHHAA